MPSGTTATTPKVRCVVLGAADAGKTSLLRRYFRQTFASSRVPTVGSDFYTKRIVEEERRPVLLQMFDTPGEVPIRCNEDQENHMEFLMDAFVERVDGVMLVYDVTNSTSFTRLRLWHAQWRRRSQTPILIVGNKTDLIPRQHGPARPATVPPRDVFGFRGSFKGKDFRYEYRVDHQVGNSSGSTPTPTPTPTNSNHRHEISTFTSTATNLWTEDGTYLDSLLGTEDRSNPDRDMVKLWCMRNGLQHVEVSAFLEEGGNVSAAMDTLVQLVLQSREQSLLNCSTDTNDSSQPQTTLSSYTRPNQELDLLDRYRPKDRKCCFGLCPSPWSKANVSISDRSADGERSVISSPGPNKQPR